jgi:hypothetical protein
MMGVRRGTILPIPPPPPSALSLSPSTPLLLRHLPPPLELRAAPQSGATHNLPPSLTSPRSRNSRRLCHAPPGGGDKEWVEGARRGGRNPATLHKFTLAFKIKAIDLFAEEEEDEDTDRFARSPLPGADGVLAGQRWSC